MLCVTRRLRALLRALAVAGIVLACGAFACMKPVGEIGYAPGHGYVVKVQHRDRTGFETLYSYYIFDTYEQASRFYNAHYTGPNWPAGYPAREVLENQNDQIDYDRITRLLQAPILPVPAVPDLPQPIPQTPL